MYQNIDRANIEFYMDRLKSYGWKTGAIGQMMNPRTGRVELLGVTEPERFVDHIDPELKQKFSYANYQVVAVEDGYITQFRGFLYPDFSPGWRRVANTIDIAGGLSPKNVLRVLLDQEYLDMRYLSEALQQLYRDHTNKLADMVKALG